MPRNHTSICMLLFAVLITTPALAGGNWSAMEENIRRPAVAGQFYTADAKALRKEIEGYLGEAGASPID